MRSYCFDNHKDWHELAIPLLLFTAREFVRETLGISQFKLIFVHGVCGLLKILKESWLAVNDDFVSLLECVTTFKTCLMEAGELAGKNLSQVLAQIKVYKYDRKA